MIQIHSRFEYYGYALVRPPASIVLSVADTSPSLKIKPEPPRQFAARMLKLYRDKGHPLGKTKRGFKKWIKRKFVKALGYKTFNQAVRKYK